jgi:hypothetical protein
MPPFLHAIDGSPFIMADRGTLLNFSGRRATEITSWPGGEAMEVEGKFTVKKREDGRFEVSFEPKEEEKAPKRARSFSGYDGRRRYLLDVGVQSEKIPSVQELQAGRSITISDIKVDSSRIAA